MSRTLTWHSKMKAFVSDGKPPGAGILPGLDNMEMCCVQPRTIDGAPLQTYCESQKYQLWHGNMGLKDCVLASHALVLVQTEGNLSKKVSIKFES